MLDGKPTAFFGLFLACHLIAGWEPFVFLMTVTVASKILEYSQLSSSIYKLFCIYNFKFFNSQVLNVDVYTMYYEPVPS